MNTNGEFNRNTTLRRAIRWRTKSHLTPYAPSAVKKAQKNKIRDLVQEIPLEKVYEAIVPTAAEELNSSFYIDEEDAQLLAAHRSSLRNSLRNRRKAKNSSKEKVSKTSSVPLKPKHIKLKVCRAISAIDRFFTKS